MTAIISISNQGNILAARLSDLLNNTTCYTLPKWVSKGFSPISLPLPDFCEKLFQSYKALIFVMATGIVVRSIAPWIKSKTTDPAVIVIDDKGDYVISLLSGHLGGANALTKKIASLIDAQPVITTASDINNLPSVDLLAMENDLIIDSMDNAKTISAMIVNHENIVVEDSSNILPHIILPEINGKPNGKIIISNKKIPHENLPHAKLIPKNIILGIGCKKGISPEQLIQFIDHELKRQNIDPRSICAIASISIKKEEAAILEAANYYRCKCLFFESHVLKSVDHLFEGSSFVKEKTGVASVSTTAAFIAGNLSGKFIIQKEIYKGITLSIFEKNI